MHPNILFSYVRYFFSALIFFLCCPLGAQNAESSISFMQKIYQLDDLSEVGAGRILGIETAEINDGGHLARSTEGKSRDFKLQIPLAVVPLVDESMAGSRRGAIDGYSILFLSGKIQTDRLCIRSSDFFSRFPETKFVRNDPLPEPFDPNFNLPKRIANFYVTEKRQYGSAFHQFRTFDFFVSLLNCIEI